MSDPQNDKLSPPEQLKRGQETAVPAIVLRVRPFRESDLIAHLFTPAMGKVSVIARHARGSRKRFPSSLDLFDRGTARLTLEKSGALGVKEFSPSHSLTKIRYDLDKLTLASLLCEAFDIVLPEDGGLSTPQLFEVLDLSLNAIDEAPDVRSGLRAAFIALASLTKESGIADISAASPGSKALLSTLDAIEKFCERRLATKSSLRDTLKKAASETSAKA
jgi:recombinational DNA repair protein (RecF pathway)